MLVGETDFVHPDLPSEQVKLHVYLACPKFNDEKLQADFGNLAENFVPDLKNYVLTFNAGALESQVKANSGTLPLHLNGKQATLKHGTHFYFNAKDKY